MIKAILVYLLVAAVWIGVIALMGSICYGQTTTVPGVVKGVTVTVVSTPVDTVAIYNRAYAAGRASVICPPASLGYTQAQLDSAKLSDYRRGLLTPPDSVQAILRYGSESVGKTYK